MKTIVCDCAGIKSAEEFHKMLARELNFPEDYGHNLDALFDCLTECREDRELILNSWHNLEYSLKDYSGKALYVFRCACQENPHLIVTLHP